jgi:hypothetical protein
MLSQTDIDHYYFNLVYTNNSLTSYVPAKVIQQYDRTILKEPQNFNASIIRFSISSDSIGLVNQKFPTTSSTTNFFVGLSYNGIFYDTPIVLPVINSLDGSTSIQAVYSVNDFLDLINTGYATSIAALPGGAPLGTTGSQPLMTFDPATGLYTMNIPSTYGVGTVSNNTTSIGVSMSYALYRRFGSMSTTINNPLLNNNHDVLFTKVWRGDNYTQNIVFPVSSTGTTGTIQPYMQIKQYSPFPSSIEDIDRLIITSVSIPSTTEFRAQQLSSQFGSNNSNQTLNILTDFYTGSDNPIVGNAENLVYQPTLLRLTSLHGNSPMTQLDVQIFTSDVNGNIMPLLLGPLDTIDVKLGFIRKGLTS